MRKPTFYICENKDADQLQGDREADQPLCFGYIEVQSLYFLNPGGPRGRVGKVAVFQRS